MLFSLIPVKIGLEQKNALGLYGNLLQLQNSDRIFTLHDANVSLQRRIASPVERVNCCTYSQKG
jgi:hypothetical protein